MTDTKRAIRLREEEEQAQALVRKITALISQEKNAAVAVAAQTAVLIATLRTCRVPLETFVASLRASYARAASKSGVPPAKA